MQQVRKLIFKNNINVIVNYYSVYEITLKSKKYKCSIIKYDGFTYYVLEDSEYDIKHKDWAMSVHLHDIKLHVSLYFVKDSGLINGKLHLVSDLQIRNNLEFTSNLTVVSDSIKKVLYSDDDRLGFTQTPDKIKFYGILINYRTYKLFN